MASAQLLLPMLMPHLRSMHAAWAAVPSQWMLVGGCATTRTRPCATPGPTHHPTISLYSAAGMLIRWHLQHAMCRLPFAVMHTQHRHMCASLLAWADPSV
eukprot:349749-Chlamydomonas_euryale.AAC.4